MRGAARGFIGCVVFLVGFGLLIWIGSFENTLTEIILWGLTAVMSIAYFVHIWNGRIPTSQVSVLPKRLRQWLLDEPRSESHNDKGGE